VRRKDPAGGPVIPDWIRHEHDGGFDPAAWAEPGDFEADPHVAESRARGRWMTERNRWLADHPDAFDVLLEQLRQMCRDVP